jgi:hypothetical protein
MLTHITGSGHRERRSKGHNNKPKIYLAVEVFLLCLIIFIISFAKIKFLTVISILGAVFFIIISSIPRYKKIISRQSDRKIYNHKK